MKHKPHYSKIALVALIFTSALIGLLRFDSFQVGAFSDDAHYIVLAESLASGQGYRLINYPNAPTEWAFPPGWPILLSPLVALFPGNYAVLKLLSFALWVVSIPLMYRLFARHIETPYLEVLIALIALNPGMLGISGMLMSEAAYLFFSLLALYLFELWDSHQDKGSKARYWLSILAFTVTALYTQLIRTVGLSILLTFVVYLLFSRRFRQAGIVAAIFFLGMLPQLWLNSQNGGSLISPGYQSQVFGSSITAKFGQVWANVQAYSNKMIANSLIPVFGPKVASVLNRIGAGITLSLANVLILLLIVIGVALSLKRFRISVLYVGFYFLGILAFWNPSVGSAQGRFLIPVVPFLYFYLLQAIIWTVRWTITKTDKRTLLIVTGATSLIILISLARNVQDWRNPIRNRITDLSIGTVWIDENTPSDSIVMARNPVPAYLYARRRTVAYPAYGQDIEEYIEANGVDYIIVSPKLQTPRSNELDTYIVTRLLPVLTSNQDRFRLVYKNTAHNVTVYECRSNP